MAERVELEVLGFPPWVEKEPATILKEKSGSRCTIVWTDKKDVVTLSNARSRKGMPLVYEFLSVLIEEARAVVESICLVGAPDGNLYARVVVGVRDRLIPFDNVTATEAIIFALYTQKPLYIEEEALARRTLSQQALEQLGIKIPALAEADAGEAPPVHEHPERSNPSTSEELERLGPFRETVEGLDLETL